MFQAIDYCRPNPCKNGGKCKQNDPGSVETQCECVNGYHGDRCQSIAFSVVVFCTTHFCTCTKSLKIFFA